MPLRYPLLKVHCVPSHFEDMSIKEAEVLVEVWTKGEPTTEQLINNEPLKEFRQRLQAVIRKVRASFSVVGTDYALVW